MIRVIEDSPRCGTENMAIDECLMRRQKTSPYCASLRFYTWKTPCITLGYFQNVSKMRQRLGASARSLPLIRRLTGGGLVRHDKDLTFAFIMTAGAGILPTDVKSSYLKINEAIREGLRERFPDVEYADCKTVPSGRAGTQGDRVCFDAPSCYDLLLGRRKIVGASQRRKDGVLLHQSTIFLPECDSAELIALILKGMRSRLGLTPEMKPLTPDEIEEARSLEMSRYGDAEWANPSLVYAPS